MATPSKNLNALLVATVEFAFADGALTAALAQAAGYRDVGNVIDLTPKFDPTVLDHYGSYRGIRRKDASLVTQQKLEFTVKLDQWDQQKVEWMLGSSTGTAHTQVIRSAYSGDSWAFNTTPSGTVLWYDVLISGARTRKLTTVTIATLTEGTDFEVDLELGRVRFLVTQSAARVPVITCAAITAADAGYFAGLKPMQVVKKTGFGRITCYDQNTANPVVWDYVDFSCDVTCESASNIDGKKEGEISVKVAVTDTVGNFLLRRLNTV